MKDINLINENKLNHEMVEERQVHISKRAILIIIVSVVFALMTYAIPLIYVKVLENRISSLKGELTNKTFSEVKLIRNDMIQLNNKIEKKKNVLDDIDDKHFLMDDVFNQIKQSTPEGCTINSIQYKDKVLRISGKAENGLLAVELLRNLDRLENINAQSKDEELDITQIKGLYDFQFTFILV